LKPSVAKAINELIKPIRDHFMTNPDAKKLLDQVKSYRTTR
jgi:tyrosyl-tRNA synthetase